MNPLVSVIIPTKNSARTLGTCIESIRRQSYDTIEIIVVDNESSDTTINIAQQGGATITREQNERSAQRNKGAMVSHGEYVVFIDSDMELSESVIQECVEAMEQAPHMQAIVMPEKSFGHGFWAACKAFERSFYTETPWMRAVRFFKRSAYEAIRGFDSSMIAGEDFDIHNRIEKMFGTQAIGTISAEILHNEGDLSLNALMRKKFYYGGHIRKYRDKSYNIHAYRKQANILYRFVLFTSHPRKILLHPVVFLGTVYMKMMEFIAGGMGYLMSSHYRERSVESTILDANLPSVSFVTCTLNSERLLQECLQSIADLDYPKHLIEILVVDGGSHDATREIAGHFTDTIIEERTGRPEAATAIGYTAATHEIIVNFPSDNVITDPQWLKRMVRPFMEHEDIVGSYTLRYEYHPEDNPLNRCFALFGAGDPVAYYMNKRDRVAYFEDGDPKSTHTRDCGDYYLVEFSQHNVPTLGANGFLIRRTFAQDISHDPMSFFHIDSVLDLIAQGHTKFAVVKNEIWHRTGEEFTNFFKRRIRYIGIYFRDKQARRYHVVDMRTDKWKLVTYIFYSLTFIEPLFEATRGYLKIRDWAWFLHPVMSFLCVPVYSYALGKVLITRVCNKQV